MRQPQPGEHQQLFSFPISSVPTSFWITDRRLIIIHRSGLLKTLPVLLGRRIGKQAAPGDPAIVKSLIRAHREALKGKCSEFQAPFYRELARVFVSPVRNGNDEIVGTIGRIEEVEDLLTPDLHPLTVHIVPRPALDSATLDNSAVTQALFATAAYGVCTVDDEGRVTRWNGTMERLTGISSTLTCGIALADIIPALFDQDVDALHRLTTGEHLRLHHIFFSSDGHERYFDVSLTPLPGQSFRGALGIFCDSKAVRQVYP